MSVSMSVSSTVEESNHNHHNHHHYHQHHHDHNQPPGNDSPSCVNTKSIQDNTVGNAPPMVMFGLKRENYDDNDDEDADNDDDDDDADEVSKPEERGATCKLCSVLRDVSRHQGHHLHRIIIIRSSSGPSPT